MLKKRIIAALVFAPALLAAVVLGGWVLKLVCLLIVWLMLWEFQRLTLGGDQYYLKGLGYVLGTGYALILLRVGPEVPFDLLLAAGTLLLLGAVLVRPEPIPAAMSRVAYVGLGVLYCAGLIPFLSRLRELPEGLGLAIMALFCTWGADTGAYFAGRAFGKHKLYPIISPGKTVEGLLGGVGAAVVVAFLARWVFGFELAWWHLASIGAIAACVGAAGDLAESLLKRSVGAKDSSQLIPGHGGVLDRFDGVMFVAPALHLYVVALVLKEVT